MQIDHVRQTITDTPVVIIASSLTDTGAMEARLTAAGADFRVLVLGMGSTDHREALHALQAQTGWPHLPMVFVHGRCVGGESALLDQPIARPAPRMAWTLGLAGLVPFIAGALASHLTIGLVGPHAVEATLAYGVIILAFMAGTQWGGAVNRPVRGRGWRYVVAVLPTLAIWPAWLMGPQMTLAVLLAAFAWLLLVDVFFSRRRWWPAWYLRLRAVLTAGVIGSLLVLAPAI